MTAFIPAPQRRAQPLAGKRTVVTRAVDEARYLAGRLRDLGAQPVQVPVIRIAPVEGNDQIQAAIAHLPEYDWIVFTSAYAVTNWWQLNISTLPVAESTRVASVGPRTADVLGSKGVKAEVTPREYTKERLVEALGDVACLRILVPRGKLAGPALAGLLQDRGAIVDDVVIYGTLPVLPDREQIDQLAAGMDAVLFTSNSTVKNFVAALEDSALTLDVLEGVTIACIGPVTARTATQLGLTVNVVPQHYTTEGLIEALVDHYRGR